MCPNGGRTSCGHGVDAAPPGQVAATEMHTARRTDLRARRSRQAVRILSQPRLRAPVVVRGAHHCHQCRYGVRRFRNCGPTRRARGACVCSLSVLKHILLRCELLMPTCAQGFSLRAYDDTDAFRRRRAASSVDGGCAEPAAARGDRTRFSDHSKLSAARPVWRRASLRSARSPSLRMLSPGEQNFRDKRRGTTTPPCVRSVAPRLSFTLARECTADERRHPLPAYQPDRDSRTLETTQDGVLTFRTSEFTRVHEAAAPSLLRRCPSLPQLWVHAQ
ncbi:hypothetical protein C2E23DRAFT_610074 [Lenzites betulinus]|nr:hypothetical protein C2E23DRAFT_610074 [Lenzites betulinus]